MVHRPSRGSHLTSGMQPPESDGLRWAWPVKATTSSSPATTSAIGTGWERTPWHATQRAAWEALKKAEPN